ncbi:hypothetical protein PPYR_00662 [Photinus pyralis]|uniref:Intraflagellar transport protein 43 homolog n=1 Tax=Photinus pyralis TaxID=7054 RepID=A0A1Y1JX38_PHOPY|nr:intraflagellar transport protein 43 homolog A-like [Photinus pyralis]XP_031350139.1 intraflagellar transport protein 43 homolog A-like [Photinus pyralis]KAB0798801.1 hypothetical protein PPYR_06681 [Photinus pyralis]KAB0803692.1 hypothetical protein PPYR_00662 [Photinus pyralis]
MNLEEDIKYLVEKRSAVKQGRRAAKPNSPESSDELISRALESMSIGSPVTSTHPQRSSGWAEENTAARSIPLQDDERFRNENNVIDFNNDVDIPIIPDIDEIQEDILRPTEIKPPTILINPSTYKELANELTQENAPNEFFYLSKSNDINLSLLTGSLCLEEDVKEKDEEWTLDNLLHDFVSTCTFAS